MTKTKGVQVIWPTYKGSREIDEIEYYYGLDVNRLDDVPKFTREFTRIEAVWSQHDGELVEYFVDARCVESNLPDEVRVEVTYEKRKNPKIVERVEKLGGDHSNYWSTNTIVLRQGDKRGHYEWLRPDGTKFQGQWVAFDLGAPCKRPGYNYRGSKREKTFRSMILGLDKHCCVLTGEKTTQALDAAHLIPAAKGENDVPFNGITLRADLHRIFDAGLFTFAKDGRVVNIAPGLSEYYRQLLENCDRLPSWTHERVRVTLASRPFQRRGDPADC